MRDQRKSATASLFAILQCFDKREVFVIIIGVLSDTHIPTRSRQIPEIVIETFKDVDMIIHAGDLVQEEVLYSLEELAKVEAVAGNMDPPFLAQLLGRKKTFTIEGFQFGLFHGIGGIEEAKRAAMGMFLDCDCVIFGHTHSPCNIRAENRLIFNPGSPTDRRFEKRCSFGLLRIYEEIEGEIIYFDGT